MIVDDSSVARAVISRMVAAHADFEVVALAGNAREALDALKGVKVDIVLLDVEMPGTSGIEALPDILRAGDGARVLIVSSMAEEGAELTVRALAQGAADTLPKPGTGYFAGRFSEILAERLRQIGRVSREREPLTRSEPGKDINLRDMPDGTLGCVALGASTGGLRALIDFLRPLPKKIGVPILVTQHLPAIFMPYFARQLEAASGRPARVVDDGEALVADIIHVAPGEAHLRVERRGLMVLARHDNRPAPSGCLPSVDPMLESVAEAYGDTALGVMLSGMGRDGLIGSHRLVESGGAMMVQDQGSSAIWGMPRVVAEAGLASAMLPPADLARRVALHAKGGTWR
jgi:two-component system chemotaxis response regulator CheB